MKKTIAILVLAAGITVAGCGNQEGSTDVSTDSAITEPGITPDTTTVTPDTTMNADTTAR
ncbi:hypothetical protein [Foetidibacter luteolus]|uniref:hypothetical protein n=1 Tax=Foetidibacter luteolus TaxID=2608880 RepID=UPI00129A5C50|nr:hypothetical protein [Foetidibacter luteolus]